MRPKVKNVLSFMLLSVAYLVVLNTKYTQKIGQLHNVIDLFFVIS